SMGRLFDAVAALIGVRETITYEAQAGIELEGLLPPLDPVVNDRASSYTFDVYDDGDGQIIDPAPILAAVVADVRRGVPPEAIAGRFHAAVANAIAEVCVLLRADTGLETVALSGGVFQNVHLLDAAVRRLQDRDFTVLTHRVVPANDGGLALGQAIIGCHQLES
ncbi:MAG: hypothetical protein KDB63_03670, partial [Nocardioidaceae bacterium]|nr:hypothetical protein [Nocardioidaceae bacterium]